MQSVQSIDISQHHSMDCGKPSCTNLEFSFDPNNNCKKSITAYNLYFFLIHNSKKIPLVMKLDGVAPLITDPPPSSFTIIIIFFVTHDMSADMQHMTHHMGHMGHVGKR